MITLMASIAGFITSIMPELLKYLRDKSDKKHELAILDKQIEFSQTSASNRLEEVAMNHDMLNMLSLYSTYKTGVTWVDALNGTVRPMLAYSFFIAYVFVKYLQYKSITLHAPFIEYMEIIWSNDDRAIFAGIISFYYGQRTFSKLWKK